MDYKCFQYQCNQVILTIYFRTLIFDGFMQSKFLWFIFIRSVPHWDNCQFMGDMRGYECVKGLDRSQKAPYMNEERRDVNWRQFLENLTHAHVQALIHVHVHTEHIEGHRGTYNQTVTFLSIPGYLISLGLQLGWEKNDSKPRTSSFSMELQLGWTSLGLACTCPTLCSKCRPFRHMGQVQLN